MNFWKNTWNSVRRNRYGVSSCGHFILLRGNFTRISVNLCRSNATGAEPTIGATLSLFYGADDIVCV